MKALVYGSPEYNALKAESLALYGVVPTEQFNATSAARQRIDFLKRHLRSTGMKGYVLGISGGVDSTTLGRLCQLACEELRNEDYFAQFIAVRLPAGVQLDEADAQAAIKFINADKTLTVNIGDASKNISNQGVEEYRKLEGDLLSPEKIDFILGNVKARIRMVSQYQIAAMYGALVIGSDHSSEAQTGYYTKWGDQSCDLIALNGLNKTQVRLVAKELGAPQHLYEKAPTADLEELNPGKLDDVGFGFEYAKLDLFLEGKEIDKETEFKIIRQFQITQHKRQPIPGFIHQ